MEGDATASLGEQLRAVAESVPIHLLYLDAHERVLFANSAAATMWGRTPETMAGRTVAEIVGPDAQAALHEYTRRVLAGEQVIYESAFHAPDGSIRTFLNTYTIDRGEDGTVRGFVATGTDITERKASEQALEASVSALEEQRMLRERFVATLSHDLRTPLSAARMSAQLIVRTDDPERMRTLALRIEASLSRADAMIRDLLDANRINAGQKVALDFESCDLVATVREAVEDLATVHGDRFDLRAPNALEGRWSCAAIRRMIENLCTNAVRYGAPHGRVTITVTRAGDHVTIDVQNEGNPIPPEEQAWLFQPFHRTATAIARERGGWGLGLTLTKGLAEAHGGSVSVKSAEETGTIFTVTLPLDVPRS